MTSRALGIGLVADALSVLVSIVHDGVGRLLRGNERGRDLTLGSGDAGLLHRCRSSGLGRKLSLGIGKLLLGGGQTVS